MPTIQHEALVFTDKRQRAHVTVGLGECIIAFGRDGVLPVELEPGTWEISIEMMLPLAHLSLPIVFMVIKRKHAKAWSEISPTMLRGVVDQIERSAAQRH
jgi:hypothetical protein